MLGTRFLAAAEAATHEVYRQHLIAATVHTLCFDGGWPNATHRALRNTTLHRWQEAGSPPAPLRPGEGDVVATDALHWGWGIGSCRPSDTNNLPTVCAEIHCGAHRLRFGLAGESEAELPVDLGLIGPVGVAEHGGDVAERGHQGRNLCSAHPARVVPEMVPSSASARARSACVWAIQQ
ncbi:hypothetical protein HNR22_001768 [Micromonospora jinlongensis]|uniref:Nitronate monooxygenase domain-containing protein n=1 Tax=Micromonospora jinlongensis TaxID=1287877 RepID=A0A7Z0BCN5_9ACTN|nr:hypothetical protein [Micromonospora jinlongensis]NYH42041.1 hypothetical protein [Micromonospora jinlongensis]